MPKKEINFSGPSEPDELTLADRLTELAAGLFYTSESDFPIEVFIGKDAEECSRGELIKQLGLSLNRPIEEISLNDFFERLTTVQDWYGAEKRERAGRFMELKQELETELEDVCGFRIGKIQIDIYVVGLEKRCGRMIGIKTKAIET